MEPSGIVKRACELADLMGNGTRSSPDTRLTGITRSHGISDPNSRPSWIVVRLNKKIVDSKCRSISRPYSNVPRGAELYESSDRRERFCEKCEAVVCGSLDKSIYLFFTK